MISEGNNMVTAPDGAAVPAGVRFDTPQLRQVAARATRLRLPLQLDWRLDTVLDPHGTHIITLGAFLSADPLTDRTFPEPVVRCGLILDFIGVTAGDPFYAALDLPLADYLTGDPMRPDRMDAHSAAVWHAFSRALRDDPSVLARTLHPERST